MKIDKNYKIEHVVTISDNKVTYKSLNRSDGTKPCETHKLIITDIKNNYVFFDAIVFNNIEVKKIENSNCFENLTSVQIYYINFKIIPYSYYKRKNMKKMI
jgi:hypothetical protein